MEGVDSIRKQMSCRVAANAADSGAHAIRAAPVTCFSGRYKWAYVPLCGARPLAGGPSGEPLAAG